MTEATGLTEVSVFVGVDGSRLTELTGGGDGGDTADGSISGDDGAHTLTTADAGVCVGGSRLTGGGE